MSIFYKFIIITTSVLIIFSPFGGCSAPVGLKKIFKTKTPIQIKPATENPQQPLEIPIQQDPPFLPTPSPSPNPRHNLGAMTLQDENAFITTVNRPSTLGISSIYISPGLPTQSYLYQRFTNTVPLSSKMPPAIAGDLIDPLGTSNLSLWIVEISP